MGFQHWKDTCLSYKGVHVFSDETLPVDEIHFYDIKNYRLVRTKIVKVTDFDAVNHPKHYCSHPSGVECIQVTEHMNFNVGNAVKYLWRADLKNGVEDLEKAAWYINREIERRKKAHENHEYADKRG